MCEAEPGNPAYQKAKSKAETAVQAIKEAEDRLAECHKLAEKGRFNKAIAELREIRADFFEAKEIEKLTLPDKLYELVICEETLEHLDEPLAALKKFKRLLCKKGQVLLSVPNSGSTRYRLLNRLGLHHRLYCPDHRHHFTESSIGGLLRDAGFKNIYITSDFIPLPGLPFNLFINARKRLAKLKPSLGCHIIARAEKND